MIQDKGGYNYLKSFWEFYGACYRQEASADEILQGVSLTVVKVLQLFQVGVSRSSYQPPTHHLGADSLHHKHRPQAIEGLKLYSQLQIFPVCEIFGVYFI